MKSDCVGCMHFKGKGTLFSNYYVCEEMNRLPVGYWASYDSYITEECPFQSIIYKIGEYFKAKHL